MGNLQVIRQIQEIYDPKTAFGNKTILGLFGELIKPNKDGNFEIDGIVKKIIGWECADCGRVHEDGDDIFDRSDEQIGRKCDCGAKHIITLYEE